MLGTQPPPPDPSGTADCIGRTERLLGRVRAGLLAALVALELAIATLAYVVSFEAIRAFAVTTGHWPQGLAWAAPLLVDTFTTAATLVILWRYLGGEAFFAAWYAWTVVVAATAVSVALNVAHAPHSMAARLFAALPPIAFLGALELLMSVARTSLPRTGRTATTAPPTATAPEAAGDRTPSANGHRDPAALTHPAPPDRTRGADDGATAALDVRDRVRALVARERQGGPAVTAAEVIAVTGRSRRRAYELLRDARAQDG
jgi:hypothetical protein